MATSETKNPSPHIIAQNRAAASTLPFHDTRDLQDARRGFLGRREPGAVTNADGDVVWDGDTYDFLRDEAPDSAHPSLWRQSQLNSLQGLFEVIPGIYQVRGMDLSNTTFIEGDTGVIVIDTLLTRETAQAALDLYREHRGERPVTGVIYTHSHADHFGGARAFVSEEQAESGEVPIMAPEGFLHHAVSENVFAGTAMNRRAAYMYGAALERGPRGGIGAGLGQTLSTGTMTLVRPNDTITTTGEQRSVDGVNLHFQMAHGTEAPSEMLIWLPDHKALCTAEDATHTLHNLLTLRGAEVRDPHAWAHYLSETIDLFGDEVEVAFASHHWPTWGREQVLEFITLQRDVYAYLHDQTVRLLNKGLTGAEIAEDMELPPALEDAWHARGYYGSVSHNVKAIYQRYMGWFDGNPARLWELPPEEKATRYLAFMGGAEAVLDKARVAFDLGDYRWVAEVISHVVYADPDCQPARDLLADCLEQLGYGSENGTWRDFFLSGTQELREGTFGTPTETNAPDVVGALTPEMLFDALAVQIHGPRAASEELAIDVMLVDEDVRYRLMLSNGVLRHTTAPQSQAAQATLTTTHRALPGIVLSGFPDEAFHEDSGNSLSGDPAVLAQLVDLLDPGDKDFAIVTP